eukprot:Colp12_sorted_trinity150504_noHs@2971
MSLVNRQSSKHKEMSRFEELAQPIPGSPSSRQTQISRNTQRAPSTLRFIMQVWPPLIIAGFGSVFAGLLLDRYQNWDVFHQVSQLFILVPALLDLKGDLEMTLNSRLSTAANKGLLSDLK